MQYRGFERHVGYLRRIRRDEAFLRESVAAGHGLHPRERITISDALSDRTTVYLGGRNCRPGVRGYAYPSSRAIHLCPEGFNQNERGLQRTILRLAGAIAGENLSGKVIDGLTIAQSSSCENDIAALANLTARLLARYQQVTGNSAPA